MSWIFCFRKVWAAEEREKQKKKRERELLEQRNHEVQIEELRKALREKERVQSSAQSAGSSNRSEHPSNSVVSVKDQSEERPSFGLQKSRKRKNQGNNSEVQKRQKRERNQGNDTFTVQSVYKEDVFRHGHKAVWGSYYDKDKAKWGYACCKELDKSASCHA